MSLFTKQNLGILAQYAIHRLYNNSAPQYLYTAAQQELTQISTRNAPGI